jgi:hypothetical protein
MLTSLAQAVKFQSPLIAFSDGTLDESLPHLRQFWLDMDGRAKENPAVWDVYGRKKASQQDARKTLLHMSRPFCPSYA